MANSKLQGKKWDIDTEIMKHLKRNFKAYKGPKNVEGYERLRDLVSSDSITYETLKRIKNFFDGFEGKKNETPYLLNGGTKMKEWVNKTLESARNQDKGKEKNMSDIGMGDHYKKDNDLKPSSMDKRHVSNKDELMGEGIKEVQIISNLIKQIDKNKQLCHIF
jgi:hypothetical protein